MKSRITRMTAALLAAVLSLSLLVGCKPKKELTRYTTIFYDVFDTVTQVIAYCESEEEFNTQMQALHLDLIAYNQLYDIYLAPVRQPPGRTSQARRYWARWFRFLASTGVSSSNNLSPRHSGRSTLRSGARQRY